MGRTSLKQLKQSTLLTFFQACEEFGLKRGEDYVYNSNDGVITFFQNDSQIFLKDLFHYPSDPDYQALGSTEYTGAFIDEAGQITEKAKNIVLSRLRYKLNDFGVIPKLLMTCNPSKNFLYSEFYKPWKQDELPSHKKYVPATVQDNPYTPQSYIDSLKQLDKVSRERLLYGNWEYDDDPASLVDFDAITDIFSNTVEGQYPGLDQYGAPNPDKRKRYISCDVARFGEDRTVITVWKGLECVSVTVYTKKSMTEVARLIQEKAAQFAVPMSRIIIDEDGVGGGVKDILRASKGFIANSRPFRGENYRNLKSQCGFLLAKKINDREIGIRTENLAIRNSIIEELEQLKAKDIDKDGKSTLIPKDKMKENLGRSPDLLDTLIMRMYFELIPEVRLSFA